MGDKNNMKVKYMNECPNQKYYIEYLEGVGYDLKIPFKVAIYIIIRLSMSKIDFKLNELCYCSINLKSYKSYLTP